MTSKKIILSSIVAASIISSTYANELASVDVWDTEVISSSLNLGDASIETKQADHLSDLLRDMPGVNVGGTHSINNRLNIRGMQDENLEISIDGAKVQNVNMFHHIGNLLINPDILKKADIQVGANSVVHGGLGGAASFETKDGEDLLEEGKDYGARVSGTYNSNKSTSGSIAAYGKVGKGGDFLIYHNQVQKENWEDGEGTETFGVEGDISNTLVKYGQKIGDTQKITISHDSLVDEGDYSPRPDFGRAYNEARTGTDTFDTKYTRQTTTLNYELDLGDKFDLDASIYSNINDLRRYEGPLTSGSAVRPPWGIETSNTQGQLDGEVTTLGVNLKARSNVETGSIFHSLTYGALYDEQESKVTWDHYKYGDDEAAISRALYLENSMDFDNGLILTPGIRYNSYYLNGAYGRLDDTETTYSLATEYGVTDDLTLLASATTLFKGPEMVDVLASNRVAVADNEDLKSETGLNQEWGFRYIKDSVWGADTIGFSFKMFQTTIEDYIDQQYNSMSNAGDLEITGYESSFVYNKGDLNTLVSYSHSDSKFKESGEPLEKEPGDSLSLGIDYKITSNIALSWDSLFVMEEDNIPTDTTSTDFLVKEAYNVHDIAVNYKPASLKGLTVIAGVDNIFNETYIYHTSVYESNAISGTFYNSSDFEPGRNVKLTASYKF